jgi:hypothetical protein
MLRALRGGCFVPFVAQSDGAPPIDRLILERSASSGLVGSLEIVTADGDGYYIRGGIIVVPKCGVIRPGTVVEATKNTKPGPRSPRRADSSRLILRALPGGCVVLFVADASCPSW